MADVRRLLTFLFNQTNTSLRDVRLVESISYSDVLVSSLHRAHRHPKSIIKARKCTTTQQYVRRVHPAALQKVVLVLPSTITVLHNSHKKMLVCS